MAKSIRSKWRRKCRAIKRERYGKKELDRLKKTLGIDDSHSGAKDVNMSEITEVANVVDSKTVRKPQENDMDIDLSGRTFNPKTLRDKNGAYPVWLHPRKLKSNKDKKKKKKGKRGKH